jgi:hypothetical protein
MIGKTQRWLLRTAMGLLACTLLGACATGRLFYADFNADSVGAPPAKNPQAHQAETKFGPEIS